jgi:uncharacterized membrane protein
MSDHGTTPTIPEIAYGRRFNITAVTALVASVVVAPLGVILSVVSLLQIKRTGERGQGLAVAALTGGIVAILIFYVLAALGFPPI